MKKVAAAPKIDSPAALLEIAVGYQKSQTLFAFAELEIPDLLNEKQMTADELAKKLKIHPLATERFLNACAALGLVRKNGARFANSDLSEKFLTRNGKNYLGGQMKRYQNRSYPQWSKLTEHLRNWEYGESAEDNPESEDQGADAMDEQHNLALLHGRALAASFDFSRFTRVLDLGGGTGAMSIALCEKLPHLRAIVFDLPENVEKAAEKIHEKNLEARIECVPGDILKDDLPENFDVALLANLLAVFDAETNKQLFKRLYDRLPPGGACLVSGWILDEDRLAPDISVLFCLEDICWNAPDVERAFTTYRDWLESAGFEKIAIETYYEPTKLISAFKK
ncbi:MAG TPA: methyltransferase [Pyrinomonadaceae bacterium]|jgi:SAM-dependent methyltransferase